MRRPTEVSRDAADGIRVIETRSARKRASFALALAAVVAVIAVLAGSGGGDPDRVPATPAGGAATSAQGEPAAPRIAEKPNGTPVRHAPAPPPATDPDPAEESGERVLERELASQPTYTLSPPGAPKSGMALFPPPGSQPILRGLVVPEDFELPEGYVRHHQVTDDGNPLPAILMFHPDFAWVDEAGAQIEVPADRVVPPELAPEGLPIEILVPPTGEPDPGPPL